MLDVQYLSVKTMLAERQAASAAERLAGEAARARRDRPDGDEATGAMSVGIAPQASPAPAPAPARPRAVARPDPCSPAGHAA